MTGNPYLIRLGKGCRQHTQNRRILSNVLRRL
jgi:hypothetical protein